MVRSLCCLLLLLGAAGVSAQNTDSAVYFQKRDSIAATPDPVSRSILQAADELAVIGLYRDALELLKEAGSPGAASSGKAHVPAAADSCRLRPGPETSWRVSGDVDYTHLEDLARADTIQPGKKDSLARLLENPLIFSSKASLSWKNAAPFVKSVDQSLYVSNQKAALDLFAAFVPAGALSLEAAIRTEKRLMNRAASAGDPLSGSSQPSVFVGDREDSLDMVGGRTTVRFQSGGHDDPVRFEAPLTVEGSRYRGGRVGYYSYDDYRAAPSVSFASKDLRRSADLRFLGEYKDYRGGSGGPVSGADSFDIYRAGPEIYGEIRRGRISGAAIVGFLYEHYPHRDVPHNVRSAEAEARLRARPLPSVEASLIARYDDRMENHRGRFDYLKDTVITKIIFGVPVDMDTVVVRPFDASFRLKGREAGVTPELRCSFASFFAARARCPVRVRSFPVVDSIDGKKLAAPSFILESLTALEPELGFEYSGARFDARAAAAFTMENVQARDYYTYISSRGWKAGADCMGRIVKNISWYAQLEYQFRRYAPYDAGSRISRNVQASSGAAIK